VTINKSLLFAHCTTHNSRRFDSPPLQLGSLRVAPKADTIGNPNVEFLTDPSEGIWYPDELCVDSAILLLWEGVDEVFINPFVTDSLSVEVSQDFTEKLTGKLSVLNSYLVLPELSRVSESAAA
jgi:hypothetical protein